MKQESFKKILVGGITLSILSVGTLPSVFAAGLDGTEGINNQDAKSYGHITINSSDETVEPTDPIEPPVDPEDPDGELPDGGTGNTAALRIDWVTPLEFGSWDLSTQTQVYPTTSYNPNVQVTDVRGTGEGWTLQVEMSNFIDEETGNILKGAELSLPRGELRTEEGNTSTQPLTYEVKLLGNGGAHQIMQAGKNEGMGTWADVFNADNVKLTVPSGNYAGDYQAELTWTLANAPQ